MSLSAGARLGPYEVVAPLGAGGMGEVYRARDPRLRREVAVKVLPAAFSQDIDRLRRFEHEAQAASALNHPNIVTIYEMGSADSIFYIAMELVEGTSLRETLVEEGALPTKRMLDIAVQIADGLAKAHGAGIVHRDLKPENVMVSKDGFVKLLDFGLAKLFAAPSLESSAMATVVREETEPGSVIGTPGYMSPEQASGKAVDFRSDQFSLGSILYEMATGRRAFQRGTGAETLTAIIREEPPAVVEINPRAPAPFRWIVERCLAKDPEERYVSTRDLARDLRSVREHLSEASVSGITPAITAPSRSALARGLLGIALLAAGLLAGVLIDRRLTKPEPPSFRQLTFRRGSILSARFAPDGQTMLYAAAWDGKPVEIFVNRTESPESRPFGMVGADVLSISGSGEMALSLNRHQVDPLVQIGTLARMGVAGGGAPREILEEVHWADWGPDGQSLAIVRDAGTRNRLEFPLGKVLYETTGYVTHPRVSRKGDLVAFFDHPLRGDDGGALAVVDLARKRTVLTPTFSTAWGVSWSPDGREVWFTAAPVGGNRSLYAVTPSGRMRLLARVTGSLTLLDASASGRVLVSHNQSKQQMQVLAPGAREERELSWLDYSRAQAISPDGVTVLFDESGEAGGSGYSVFTRKSDGSPAVRLGEGLSQSLSPDGKWALSIVKPTSNPQIVIYPTGAGEPKPIPQDGLRPVAADWMPDGKRILFAANEPGRGVRLYLLDQAGGKARALTPEGYRLFTGTVSPDGKLVAVQGPDQRRYLYPIDGGEPVILPALTNQDTPQGWTGDGRFLYVAGRRGLPRRVDRVELATGRRELWKNLAPSDSAGVVSVGGVRITPDGRYYVYGYLRDLSDLYLVDGLR